MILRIVVVSLALIPDAMAAGAAVTPMRQAVLTSPHPADFEQFGFSTALSADGDTVLAGALTADCPAGPRCGVAYVFVRNGGAWSLQATLIASDAARSNALGAAVALSEDGNVALVGSPYASCLDPNTAGCGAAYVFVRDGGVWTEQAKLSAWDSAEWFGSGVALSADGGTALVGSVFSSCPGGFSCGAMYVFVRTGGVWSQQAKLIGSDTSAPGVAGVLPALSADGGTALAGVESGPCAGGDGGCGAAYVFVRNGGVWSEVQKLTASDGAAGDGFGGAVALSADGGTALIGAYRYNCGTLSTCGSAYVFTRNGGSWTESARLAPPAPVAYAAFGRVLSLSGDGGLALVGSQPGTFLFARIGGVWTGAGQLTTSRSSSLSLSADGGTAINGESHSDCAVGTLCGSASVFTLERLSTPDIPTLGEAGTWLLSLLLAASAVILLRR